jgi:hypothetical protein
VKEQPRNVRDEIADVLARLPGGDQHLLARVEGGSAETR